MTYVKRVWKDRAVEFPNRYTKSGETSTEVTLVSNPGIVTESGTPLNAANLNNIEEGIGEKVASGKVNTDISEIKALLLEIDTREVVITRDPNTGKITQVVEKDGVTIVKTTTLTYVDGMISTVVESANGKTITYTINRVNYKLESVTKTVV